MAVADVYDALIALRPYKQPLTTQEAKRIILEGREKHFDPVLVDLFLEMEPQFARIAEYCNGVLKNNSAPGGLRETA
jgi:putative two-component system response regulator